MTADTPLVFRPSLAQRAIAGLLCAGCWVVAIRGCYLLLSNVPKLHTELRLAAATGAPTLWIWLGLSLDIVLGLAAGVLMLTTLLGLVLMEGTQVVVDETGISVEHLGLPHGLSARLGGGHLPWKQVLSIEKGNCFFLLHGGLPPGEPDNPLSQRYAKTHLKFLLVDQLERLILIILERSSNISFS